MNSGPDRERQLAELGRDLVDAAYLTGDFVLSSGEHSNYYLDKYQFETRPGILRRLAAFLAELLPADTDRIAGPELGAVPLATALSLETGPAVRDRSEGYQGVQHGAGRSRESFTRATASRW